MSIYLQREMSGRNAQKKERKEYFREKGNKTRVTKKEGHRICMKKERILASSPPFLLSLLKFKNKATVLVYI